MKNNSKIKRPSPNQKSSDGFVGADPDQMIPALAHYRAQERGLPTLEGTPKEVEAGLVSRELAAQWLDWLKRTCPPARKKGAKAAQARINEEEARLQEVTRAADWTEIESQGHSGWMAIALDSLATREKQLFAADCAEHVLPIFEQRYPQDNRPRRGINAMRNYALGIIDTIEWRDASFAARDAAQRANYPEARQAAYVAYACDGRAGDTAYSAAVAAAYSAASKFMIERRWQWQRLQWYLQEEANPQTVGKLQRQQRGDSRRRFDARAFTHRVGAVEDPAVILDSPTYRKRFRGELDNLGNNGDAVLYGIELLPRRAQRLFAADVAESVLPIFERGFPDDPRAMNCIQAGRDYAYGQIAIRQVKLADKAAREVIEDCEWEGEEHALMAAIYATPYSGSEDDSRRFARTVLFEAFEAVTEDAKDEGKSVQEAVDEEGVKLLELMRRHIRNEFASAQSIAHENNWELRGSWPHIVEAMLIREQCRQVLPTMLHAKKMSPSQVDRVHIASSQLAEVVDASDWVSARTIVNKEDLVSPWQAVVFHRNDGQTISLRVTLSKIKTSLVGAKTVHRKIKKNTATKSAPSQTNPLATPAQVEALRQKDPLAALHHPNCSLELWWELAALHPLEAEKSALWGLNTLEAPERWFEVEKKNATRWMGAGYETMSAKDLRLFGADCVEHVLPLFERAYPQDKRPRHAIEVARRYANGKVTLRDGSNLIQSTAKAVKQATEEMVANKQQTGGVVHTPYRVANAAWETLNEHPYAAANHASDFAAIADRNNSEVERVWQWRRLRKYLSK